ncbi:MAG: DEAD/DEAH box helicase [Thaumarchaeota archaeon]|nr:DEAD/DEAH box helicase [Nitrososphaerota archaeon]MDE0265652.1 DEAD/DEAH box helicase [Nitrososphaerota archaeon]
MRSAKYDHTLRNTEQAFLALEAKRFWYAFEYDPVLGMSVSRVDPLPHQIEAVYGHVLKKSRIRFMLAHDPGAGKTIMAGLIIKELELREGRKRVLIVVPGQLREQWRWEMQDKFDDGFEVVDRAYFEANGRGDAWRGDHLITSIDFAKREDIADSLRRAGRFDMAIVDEAHKMSAYSQGNSTSKTRRYRLGEVLSANTEHLLFLTATPHKGDTKNFQLLLDLLEPGYLAGEGMIESSIRRGDNPLFLRRAKEDMRDFENMPLFMPRSVETPDVRLSAKERALYNAMSKYVKEQYNLALQSSKGHNVTFALIILQRRGRMDAWCFTKRVHLHLAVALSLYLVPASLPHQHLALGVVHVHERIHDGAEYVRLYAAVEHAVVVPGPVSVVPAQLPYHGLGGLYDPLALEPVLQSHGHGAGRRL